MNIKLYRVGLVVTAVIMLAAVLAAVNFSTQLSSTKNQLTFSEEQLQTTKTELGTTENNLSSTQDQLKTTVDNLTLTQSQLTSTRSTLSSTQNDLKSAQTDLKSAQNQVAGLQSSMSGLQTNLTEARAQVDDLQTNLNRLTSSYAYVAADPTSAAMQAFLKADTTDSKPYITGSYVCWNYAADVIANAAKQHIRCGFVYVEFPGSAHAVVAFNTTDKGLIYIEPQSDEVVQLKVGVHYYLSIIPTPGYHYAQPSYDDTVKIFDIIW
jgi:septal ring factor EnvC (AmiA/AmiB activator)